MCDDYNLLGPNVHSKHLLSSISKYFWLAVSILFRYRAGNYWTPALLNLKKSCGRVTECSVLLEYGRIQEIASLLVHKCNNKANNGGTSPSSPLSQLFFNKYYLFTIMSCRQNLIFYFISLFYKVLTRGSVH